MTTKYKKNFDILRMMHNASAKTPNPSNDKQKYKLNEKLEWVLYEEEKACCLCDCIEFMPTNINICDRCINIINGLNKIDLKIISCDKCDIIYQCKDCFINENSIIIKEMLLNNDQIDAIYQLRNLYLKEKSYGYCIFGFAGSGKTYIISSFLGLANIIQLIDLRRLIYKYGVSKEEMLFFIKKMDNYKDLLEVTKLKENKIKIVCCAPTNKATSVIKQNIDEKVKYKEFKESISAVSLHKLLQYKMVYKTNGEKEFIRKPKHSNIFYTNDIIVIDESSMIRSNELFEVIKDLGKEFSMNVKKTDNILKTGNQLFIDNENLKYSDDNAADKYAFVIFLGDDAQLPPYSETNSLVFNMKLPFIQLKQIMRTKSNGIKYISNSIRKIINQNMHGEPSTLLDLLLKHVKDKYENIKFMNKTTAINYFIQNMEDNIYLCWTHKNRQDVIDKIRKKLYKNTNNRFNNGEYLIFNDFYQIKTNSIHFLIYLILIFVHYLN